MSEDEIRARALKFLESESPPVDSPSWKTKIETDAGLGSGLLRQWMRAARIAPVIGGLAAVVLAIVVCVGWALGVGVLGGAYFGAPAAPVATAVLLGMLGGSIFLLRSKVEVSVPQTGARGRAGWALAFISGFAALTFLLNELGEGLDINWADQGAWATPSIPVLILTLTFSLALITLDRDGPRHRWSRFFEPALGVMVLAALLSHGYQVNSILDSASKQEVSFTTAIGLVLIYVSYVCLRPDRGLVGFLLSEGPGPSMARYLVPTAIVLPAVIGVGEYMAGRFGEEQRSFGQGGGEILVLIVLLGVIAVSSQRLQRYYSRWREATSVLAEQADVLKGMSEGVAVIRVSDSRIVLTNPQFDLLHRYDRGDLIGSHIDDMKPGDLSGEEETERSRVTHELITTGSSRYESRSIARDRSELWCRCTAVLSEHPIHGPVLILVKTDITEEHLAKSAGREAELRFRQVFEQSPIGLCLVQENGTFDHVNAAFEKITGYTGEELREMTFADITFPEDLELDLKLSTAMFAGETDGFEMEKRYVRKDGQIVWIYLTARMLRNADGHASQALSMVEDITERHELSRQLQHLADHDPLTGLFNRRRFEDELGQAIDERSDRKGLAILNIDLDNFKFINDTYGHSVGDQLIIRTAELLKKRLRTTDTLARQGGDEFVVVLRDIDREGALRIARELSQLVASDVRVDGPDYSARVTASIGVAFTSPDQDISEEKLMIHADVAMYEAKDAGRNGARLYDPQEESKVGQSLDWVARIRSALSSDDFVLYAQPIASFRGGGAPHHELFIRMRDRDGSIVAPGAFLPIAERHDLVQEIDQWVIRKAIGILAGASGSEIKPRLCVNLSGRSVGDPGLLRVISEELESTGADPSGLIFEVTETSAIGNIASAQTFAASLADLGCRFALDDFGTGFASFYYLKHIACDYVKIDGEFIRQIALDPTDRLLVRALVEISNGMGKLTIAEQVEDAETLELLREYGVDFAQGYHVGRPKPVEEVDLNSIPALLRDSGAVSRTGRDAPDRDGGGSVRSGPRR
ncbi:MAG TPA: EAL domain-containing protein [Solirubrobacterales bacterium]|nr:EAL domain-containing protein [Solirubrobacterales bacterium]